MQQFVAIIILSPLLACSGPGNKTKQVEKTAASASHSTTVEVNNEAKQLLKYLETTGDYVNSRNFPSLIKASAVYKELDGKIKIVDLRSKDEFAKGHIKGAVNVEFTKIPDYFSNGIKPFEFDKIVMVCSSGQVSGYAASLLRLMGYGNVYALRWGMSGWNKDFAKEVWLKEISDKFAGKLEVTENERNFLTDFPLLNTGKSSGEEILSTRFAALFAAGYEDAFITADKVFERPRSSYVINFERKDKYDAGHIPGAIRYKTNGTLGIVPEMESIPTDRDVAVYCGTGHNSAFVTAYLRLFGYHARAVLFGNNAFMHSKMVQDKQLLSWLPFTENEIEKFPYVKN